MKKLNLLIMVFVLGSVNLSAQFWNTIGLNNGILGNTFGTFNNYPIEVYTNSTQRMHINENGTMFQGVNTDGYIGIGANPTDVRSRLTITGTNNTVFPGAGYRAWMKTGVFNLENSDNLYVGMKDEAFNRSDAIIAFGDDNSGGPFNNLRILFTPAGGSFAGHLELARFTATGNIGFGPVFTNATQPQSLLHLNRNGQATTFLQFTNQLGTGQLATDGLRLGFVSGIGYLRWQEITPFIFQTDWNGGSGGTASGERMRITTVSAPGVPNPDPNINANPNTTRVAISEDGATPITEPRSLLHLGYNTGVFSNPPGSNDGWRPWMDIGTFTSNGTDNMYVGLKREAGAIPAPDRADAVINWGDNDGSAPFNGPDNLRFIFTSTQTSLIPPLPNSPAISTDGLEVMRMEPGVASTLSPPNYGMVGIGNFSPTGPNTAPADQVDAKLDIDGDLRIRTVTQDNSLTQILAVDPADHNRVHWVDASILGGGNVLANDGVSIDPNNANTVQLGQLYPGTPQFGGIGQLLNDREIPLLGHNIHFTGISNPPGVDRISIGAPISFFASLTSNIYNGTKLFTANTVEKNAMMGVTNLSNQNGDFYTGVTGIVEDYVSGVIVGVFPTVYASGVKGIARSNNSSSVGVGVFGFAENNTYNMAIRGYAIGGSNTSHNYGGYFKADASTQTSNNVGVYARSNGSIVSSTGVRVIANNGIINTYGIEVMANSANGAVYGIHSTALGVNSFAGYFVGNVNVQGQLTENNVPVLTSDSIFKNNIGSISNALSIIDSLQPKIFHFDTVGYQQMNFSSRKQYGFIAQQVDSVLPELVYNSSLPAKYDSLGNQISPAINFKSLNYNAFIAILMGGMQQQQDSIQTLESENATQQAQIDTLTARLNYLENCLSNLLPILCQLNQSAIQQTDQQTMQQLIHTLNIKLRNDDYIVLEQNMPNPFKEHTVIRYYIPESVGTAAIVFYSSYGKLIKKEVIETRGHGRINVYGQDLSSGIYTYSLIADGNIVKTKRMVKIK